MDNGIINIDLDENLISIFVHKPYNFRKGAVSSEKIMEQISKIEHEIGYKFGRIIRAEQTHSNNVRVVYESNIGEEFEDVDGLITNLKDVALVTSVADCQAILLYDSEHKVIGNIHSGWRGTLGRISANAINTMVENFHSNPEDIRIYISPSIHQCHFEVGEELKHSFEEEFKEIDTTDIIKIGEYKDGEQKYFIDTIELNKRVFLGLGINEKNIIISEECSVCNNEKFHSYRKDKPNDGRNIALISLK